MDLFRFERLSVGSSKLFMDFFEDPDNGEELFWWEKKLFLLERLDDESGECLESEREWWFLL